MVQSKRTCQRLRRSIGVVCMRMYHDVRGSAPMMSAAHLPLTTEDVFSRLRVEKERSGVAVGTCKVTSTCPDLVQAAKTCQCQPQSLRRACSVFCFCTHAANSNYMTKVKGYKNASSPVNRVCGRISPESANDSMQSSLEDGPLTIVSLRLTWEIFPHLGLAMGA